MPKLIFTQAEIDSYTRACNKIQDFSWEENPNLPNQNSYAKLPNILHLYYALSVWHCHTMRTHADGLFPARLLRERRPNEPLEVFEYRAQIYVAKTKPVFNKVYTSLQKIRRSPDWMLQFADESEFSRIDPEETLEEYTVNDFPYFTSLTNWTFTLMLRKYLIDPNAVVFIKPLIYEVAENEYLKPFPTIFDSYDVLDYAEGDYCVLNDPGGCTYYVRTEQYTGKRLYLVTTERIFQYDQIDKKGTFELVLDYEHGIGILPAFKLKGILVDQASDQFMYESKISGMLPELDEAVREYSDLQAAKVMHIYPERWEYTNNECTHCKGTGRLRNPLWTETCGCDHELLCDTCKGSGYINAGPYAKITLRPPSTLDGQTAVPTPPAGIVQKDVEVVRLQEEGVNGHIYAAYAAINMEFAANVPLAQSGVAKSFDRDESNNFAHSVAEDIVACMDNIMKIVAYYRYKGLYSFEQIDDMLPNIPVPENFDVLYINTAEKELADAKTNKINPVILNAMEIDYASKRFNDSNVRDLLILELKLDPLPNISADEKMSMLSNEGVTQETYIISCNIQSFVQRALEENQGFAAMKLPEQQAVIKKYAQEQITAASAKAKIVPIDQGGLLQFQAQQQPASQFQPIQPPANPQPPQLANASNV